MSDTQTRLELAGKSITLLGTAHISRESVAEVERVIREERPERVCVEIDAGRYNSIVKKNDWSSLRIDQILREGKGFLLLGNLVLSSFQRRLGLELGIPYSFCDREIQTTLKRAWSKSGFWGKNKMLAALLGSVINTEKLTEKEIEELKKKSALEGMMDELASFLPSVKRVLIDERDQYLAENIFACGEGRILAVVGAGHVPGITAWLERLAADASAVDKAALDEVPAPSRLSKVLPWLIPALLVAVIAAGFVRSGWQEGLSMIGLWVLANGGLSALGSLAALAHPVTIAASIVAAPIATLNPFIGVGMITGLIEAYFRKPRVADFERLHEDILSVRGFYRNRFTRILLVFLLSSIGGMIGNFIALPYLGGALR